jgi:hypothetical protein
MNEIEKLDNNKSSSTTTSPTNKSTSIYSNNISKELLKIYKKESKIPILKSILILIVFVLLVFVSISRSSKHTNSSFFVIVNIVFFLYFCF